MFKEVKKIKIRRRRIIRENGIMNSLIPSKQIAKKKDQKKLGRNTQNNTQILASLLL